MILRLTCPECNKDSFSSSVEAFKPCPYCGIVFSGKFGTDRRKEKRIEREDGIFFIYKGKNLEAKTLNISKNGFTIKINQSEMLPIGDIVEIKYGNDDLRARIMWVMRKDNFALTGLKLLDNTFKIQNQTN